jgi:type I restriction enzyme R subunit
VVDYVEVNGYMELAALSRAPFDRPQSFVRLFDRRKQQRLVNIINGIRDNAVKPAA